MKAKRSVYFLTMSMKKGSMRPMGRTTTARMSMYSVLMAARVRRLREFFFSVGDIHSKLS